MIERRTGQLHSSPPAPGVRAGGLVIAGLTFCVLAGWGAAGCGLNIPTDNMAPGDGGAAGTGGALGTSSGVAPGIRLMNLSFDQATALCNWANQKQGGYGRSVTCSSGSVQSTNSSAAGCVQRTLALGGQCLALTVGNIEDCANATGTDLCKLETAAPCGTILTCS